MDGRLGGGSVAGGGRGVELGWGSTGSAFGGAVDGPKTRLDGAAAGATRAACDAPKKKTPCGVATKGAGEADGVKIAAKGVAGGGDMIYCWV